MYSSSVQHFKHQCWSIKFKQISDLLLKLLVEIVGGFKSRSKQIWVLFIIQGRKAHINVQMFKYYCDLDTWCQETALIISESLKYIMHAKLSLPFKKHFMKKYKVLCLNYFMKSQWDLNFFFFFFFSDSDSILLTFLDPLGNIFIMWFRALMHISMQREPLKHS